LVVGRVRNAELLTLSAVVDRETAKLRPAVFETDSVESDAANLDSQIRILERSFGDVLEDKFLDKVLFGNLVHHLRVCVTRSDLLRGEFGYLEGPEKGEDGRRKGVKGHELALMADVAA